jgi:hypothetical protein
MSDYLNDNELRKMDIFLSLLFSEERIFVFTLKACSLFMKISSLVKMSLPRCIFARESAGYESCHSNRI